MGRAMPSMQVGRRPPLILIADDLDVSRALLRRILVRIGFRTLLAGDGEHAITLCQRRRPNLILLDLRLPGIDGAAVLSHLRLEFDPVTLPIIMVSAEHDGEVVAACLGLGANDFVTKPIYVPTLRARIETHLSLQASHAALGELAPALVTTAGALGRANRSH